MSTVKVYNGPSKRWPEKFTNATLISPECNLSTVKDGRGVIFSFSPVNFDKPIKEWTLLYLNAGMLRGKHCHPEFDEYLMVVSGTAVETFINNKGDEDFFKLSEGDCVYIPAFICHTLTAITDVKAVAFLTKRWDDCGQPIIQQK
jgi:mannose-6-phosphate isomerase-like protein (cupin superfamily)